MATYRHHLEHHERRRATRIAPGLLTYADFGGSNGGMVLDVSERGLAVVAALAVPAATVLQLLIAGDATHEEMEVKGRVAWISESKRRLGIELIEQDGGQAGAWKRWTSELLAQPERATAVEPSWAPRRLSPAPKPPAPTVLPAAMAQNTGVPTGAAPEEAIRNEEKPPRAPILVMGASATALRMPPETVATSLEEAVAKSPAAGANLAQGEPAGGVPRIPSGDLRGIDLGGIDQRHVDQPDIDLGDADLRDIEEQLAASQPMDFAHVAPVPARAHRRWLILATVVLVVGSFGLGIFIGRRVLAQRAQPGNPASAEALPAARRNATVVHSVPLGATPGAGSRLSTPQGSLQSSPLGSATNPASPAGAPAEMANPIHQETAQPTVPAQQIANTPLATVPQVAPIAAAAKDSPATANKGVNKGVKAVDSDADANGLELRVTPNEGDEPLRVELPEEVLINVPSMEIVSQRRAFVPGVKAGLHRRIREEQLVFGPLLARVTPQPRPEALAAGAAGGDRVVKVRVTIEGDGHVSYVDPVSGPMTLMPSVMAAVREWQYGPSTLVKDRVQTQADLTIKFRPTITSPR